MPALQTILIDGAAVMSLSAPILSHRGSPSCLTIQNKYGKKLSFLRMEGQRVIVENEVRPNAGPPMHVHFLQDECLTVLTGKIGYQIQGQEPQFAGPGETILFELGKYRKFADAPKPL